MKRESYERKRILASGAASAVVTALLMFTVVEALNPHNLIANDAPSAVASSRAATGAAGA